MPLNALLVVRPYREGALRAIEAAAQLQGLDVEVHALTSKVATQLVRAAATAIGRPWIANRHLALQRQESSNVHRTAWEDLRLASNLAPGQILLRSRAMFKAHSALDLAVARDLKVRQATPDAVLAMPHAALRTFQTTAALKVLHVVNGHPRVHNDALKNCAIPVSAAELMPEWLIERVDQELSLADLILVPSRAVAAGLIANGVPASRIKRIPYGVDLSAFAPNSNAAPRPLDITYVGQISLRKGVDLILRAAVSLPKRSFTLAGPVVDERLVMNLPSNVRYIGRLDRGAVAGLMRASRTFVIPSREDAYPLAALEALTAGAHLVLSDAIGTVDLVGAHPMATVVPSEDIAALIAALSSTESVMQNQSTTNDPSIRPWSWAEYGLDVISSIGAMLPDA